MAERPSRPHQQSPGEGNSEALRRTAKPMSFGRSVPSPTPPLGRNPRPRLQLLQGSEGAVRRQKAHRSHDLTHPGCWRSGKPPELGPPALRVSSHPWSSRRGPSPAWAQSQPSGFPSPSWPSASCLSAFSHLRISYSLPDILSFLGWLLSLLHFYHTTCSSICLSWFMFPSLSLRVCPCISQSPCLSSKTVTFCVSIPLPQSLHFLRPLPSSPCGSLYPNTCPL